jgi:ribosomal subunit interface protein
MKIHYTGKLEPIEAEQKRNLERHFAKLGELVDRRGEREAHVLLNGDRHGKKAEVTMNYYGHAAVGTATHKEQFAALLGAIAKLEKQLHKVRDKWTDSKRHGAGLNGKKAAATQAATQVTVVAPSARQKPAVMLAKTQRSAKPLTVEEAVLAIRRQSRYLVFEDAETGGMSVLARDGDGALELIETR